MWPWPPPSDCRSLRGQELCCSDLRKCSSASPCFRRRGVAMATNGHPLSGAGGSLDEDPPGAVRGQPGRCSGGSSSTCPRPSSVLGRCTRYRGRCVPDGGISPARGTCGRHRLPDPRGDVVRTPSAPVPPPPRLAPVHLVSYVDSRGQAVTVLRTRAGALRLAQEITDRGGRPRVHRAELTRCEEVAATAGCSSPARRRTRLHSRVSHDPPNRRTHLEWRSSCPTSATHRTAPRSSG